jgi:hypothetical protein
MAPRGGIFLGKWRRVLQKLLTVKIDVQSACALNT